MPNFAILAEVGETRRMLDQIEGRIKQPMGTLSIQGTWLVEHVDECTGGACGPEYGHEPSCGMLPIVDLSTLDGYAELTRNDPPA